MHCSHFLDAGNQLQHYPQNSPSFFADLCICYFWILRLFWKRQNYWHQFSHSFNKCFLHHHHIHAMHLSYSKCKYHGGVSKQWRNPRFYSTIHASPIQGDTEQPSGCNKSCQLDRVPCWSSASWDMAETSCSPPTDTINLRLRSNNLSGKWGMLSSELPALCGSQQLLFNQNPAPLGSGKQCKKLWDLINRQGLSF